jgi:hypothetical protein
MNIRGADQRRITARSPILAKKTEDGNGDEEQQIKSKPAEPAWRKTESAAGGGAEP